MATLLIIDDSAAQRAALRRLFGAARIFDRILEAEDGIRGLKCVVSGDVDLVLCDVEMPGFEGEKLVLMSQSATGRRLPFLMLTAIDDPDRRARLLRQGARDVIAKPFQPDDLVARVELHLELARLQDELEEKNRLLEHLSTTDDLTGLANRRVLDRALPLEFKRARRFGTPLSVVMADLDHFKRVNDTFGHPTGDRVLQHVARLLLRRIRETDLAARFGGEEFTLVVAADAAGAACVAESWRKDIEKSDIEGDDGQTLRVTISAGVATMRAEDPDAEHLLRAADEALYRAKDQGRNRVVGRSGPDTPAPHGSARKSRGR